MRAVTMDRYGGLEVLALSEQPQPVPQSGETLVEIKASAVNPADGKWRAGMFADAIPLQFPHILGYDVAGVAAGGDGFTIGARVVGMLDPMIKGGYAEYVAVSTDRLTTMPDGLSFERAASIPTAGMTGVQLAEIAVDAQPGQTILLTGAVGAVGRFALYALKKRGARIVAAVRSGQKPQAIALGANVAIALGEGRWSGEAFDHVIDTVGGPAVAELCRHLKPGGKIATAATTPIDPEGLAATPEFYGVVSDKDRLADLLKAVAAGEIEVPIARTMPLEEAAEAQRLTDSGGAGGKIVLIP